jgi:hypothetical protein
MEKYCYTSELYDLYTIQDIRGGIYVSEIHLMSFIHGVLCYVQVIQLCCAPNTFL